MRTKSKDAFVIVLPSFNEVRGRRFHHSAYSDKSDLQLALEHLESLCKDAILGHIANGGNGGEVKVESEGFNEYIFGLFEDWKNESL